MTTHAKATSGIADPHDWLYHSIVNGKQIVSCRRCGKWVAYALVGYKPQPPRSECAIEKANAR